jgi:hypothetical protein
MAQLSAGAFDHRLEVRGRTDGAEEELRRVSHLRPHASSYRVKGRGREEEAWATSHPLLPEEAPGA